MTATDKLRRMLDERGVEYQLDHGYREFFWDFGESGKARASAIGTKGLVQMIVTGITPAQAIDATLGRETCRAIEVPMGMHDDATATVCSACRVAIDELSEMNYCPNCGRAVVE